jgi:hypothetical protein
VPTWTKVRSEYANLARTHDPSDPQMVEKRLELRALKLEDHVTRVLAQAPPMTSEQRDRIAALLRVGAGA